ncbi:MAG: universal stress protein [Candidatus Latescibacteria bacterium]|nr:universal stress protein [bacterium]MBD3422979.1 universal stress protein [Candidatus Latescibacterota bacterium]
MSDANPLGNILLYIDGSDNSLVAARMAIAMSKVYESNLRVIYVVNEKLLNELLKAKVFVQMEKMDYERDLEEDGKRYLNYVVKLADEKGVRVETVLKKGVVHEEVSREVDEYGADLVIQGELGEIHSLKDSFYEEGERIVRKAPCPVMVVRDRDRVERIYDSL